VSAPYNLTEHTFGAFIYFLIYFIYLYFHFHFVWHNLKLYIKFKEATYKLQTRLCFSLDYQYVFVVLKIF
jgi:hypothetical protein